MKRLAALAIFASAMMMAAVSPSAAATCKAQGREDNKMYTASDPQAPKAQTKAVLACRKNKKNRACLSLGCN